MAEEKSYTPEEMLKLKQSQFQTLPDELTPEEMLKLKNLANQKTIQGELGHKERAALSFASTPGQKQSYLSKKYPGIKFDTAPDGSEIVQVPGEKTWRYIDDPSFTVKDVSDFAGDVPGVVATGGLLSIPGVGPIVGAMGGGALGEIARKGIASGFLGMPNEQTTKEVAADVGLVGALSGAGGLIGKKLGGIISEPAKKISKGLSETIETGGGPFSSAARSGVQESVEMGGELGGQAAAARQARPKPGFVQEQIAPFTAPKSVAEIGESVVKGKELFGLDKSLQANRLDEIEKVLPDLKFKPHALHKYILSGKTEKDIGRAIKELPSETAKVLNDYDQIIKTEAQNGIYDQINKMGTRARLPKAESGSEFIKEMTDLYKAEKQNLGSVFESMKGAQLAPNHQIGLMDEIIVNAPKFEKVLGLDEETGQIIVKANTSKTGLSQTEYNAIKQVIGDINDPSLNFKEMQNIREYLRKLQDPMNPTRSTSSYPFSLTSMANPKRPQNPHIVTRIHTNVVIVIMIQFLMRYTILLLESI